MARGPIMIVAGGTGGHVFPGLAVAEAIRARSGAVVWMGTQRGLEARLVPAAGIEIEWITVSGLRGRGWTAWIAAPFNLLVAVWQALAAVRRRRPAAVLGLGGFVSGPGGLAAWLTRRPLVIHEQNAVAGTANRWLARLTKHVYEAFPDSFPGRRVAAQIGNPVRAEIRALAPPAERFAGRRAQAMRLLVIGGSQGARVLNREVPAALARLGSTRELDVWHQAGREIESARAAYEGVRCQLRLDQFIEDMAEAYAWADLVVCRAGALTIAELMAAGLGAVLVPYPYAIDDHQTRNAACFVANGAGVLIPESELDAARLQAELARVLDDRDALLGMAERAREQMQGDAADVLARACLDLAEANA